MLSSETLHVKPKLAAVKAERKSDLLTLPAPLANITKIIRPELFYVIWGVVVAK